MSLHDVAQEAAVSLSTASMALNNKAGISRATHERVMDAARRLGYAHFRRSHGHCIGVWVPPPEQGDIHFQSMLLRGISLASVEAGYQTIYITTANGPLGVAIPLPDPAEVEVEGVIVLGAKLWHLSRLCAFRGPIVLVDTYRQYPHIPSVDNDDEGGAYLAVRHLLNLGHRSIAYIGSTTAHGRQTWNGYRRAMAEVGAMIDPRMIDEVPWGSDHGYHAMIRMLETGTCPKALFCGGDELAYGAVRALQERGFSIPQDIAVVAMDDIHFSVNLNPPLTTVHIPVEEMGAAAVQLLLKLITGAAVSSTQIVLNNHLVIRDSCGAKSFTLKEEK